MELNRNIQENLRDNRLVDDSPLVSKAIGAVLSGQSAFCKFLSANDSGETGGHQSGILISKSAREMLFSEQEIKDNHILKKTGRIKWQHDFETNCTLTWYASKNELRMTGFGRGFCLLRPVYTGALFVFVKEADGYFQGFIFNTDKEIRCFLDSFGMTPADTNHLMSFKTHVPELKEQQAINEFVAGTSGVFPKAKEMSSAAREIWNRVSGSKREIITNPDHVLVRWTEGEYNLFLALEEAQYGAQIAHGFDTMEDFVNCANTVLNRRKSRAGKSLENHLAAIFDEHRIQYSTQAVTEGKKRPDFLFPSAEAYHDMSFSLANLCTLAAKTTCKDRWRQILNEANRLKDENKYLCTLQPGISGAQMDEMQSEKVILVVPKPYISAYPRDRQNRIWSLGRFVDYVKQMEGIV